MTTTTLFFAFYALALTLAVAILWIKSNRPAKEDPRLSRGLQLLQSKISVLEDLSDRTERQVQQLMSLLEERARLLQGKILQAHETINKIEQSMNKSLSVAKIFQDKIPHEEIIERQNSAKFVLAAKMAHQGKSVEEIMQEVDLPQAEIEFIAKVNRDELTFSEAHLPDWAKVETDMSTSASSSSSAATLTAAFQQPQLDLSGLNSVQNNFKAAVQEVAEQEKRNEERRRLHELHQQQALESARRATQNFISSATQVLNEVGSKTAQVATTAVQAAQTAASNVGPVIKKVQFPKIDNLDR